MKTVLINPGNKAPWELQQKCFPPVNLLYMAASLIKNGHETRVIDANALNLSDDDVVREVASLTPDVIGVSVLSEILEDVHRLIRLLRKACPESVIVAGGPHATALPERTLRGMEDVDHILRGECEESIVELCGSLETGNDIHGIRGIYSREDIGKTVSAPPAIVSDQDSLPHPARHLLKGLYEKKVYYIVLVRERPVDTLITSRGCPHRCAFCCNVTDTYRARSPRNVFEEIMERYDRGIRNFDIADANFTFDRDRAEKIFDLIIEEGIKISFRIKSRSDSLDEELVRKAKCAGAYLISVGMESGSQKVLDRMMKGTKVGSNAAACRMVLSSGLRLNTGWVIGFPGETREDIGETVKVLKKIKPTTANINILVPYPGTAVYEEAKQKGTLVGDWEVNSRVLPWVRLPWTDTYGDLETIRDKVKNEVYYRPYYMIAFGREIICNLNGTLARYAIQEVRRSLRRGLSKKDF